MCSGSIPHVDPGPETRDSDELTNPTFTRVGSLGGIVEEVLRSTFPSSGECPTHNIHCGVGRFTEMNHRRVFSTLEEENRTRGHLSVQLKPRRRRTQIRRTVPNIQLVKKFSQKFFRNDEILHVFGVRPTLGKVVVSSYISFVPGLCGH